MNFRHVAALTLVVWYLMLPPATNTLVFNPSAPLSEWHINDTYYTPSECEEDCTHVRERAAQRLQNSPARWPERDIAKAMNVLFGNAQCIRSDDPRLTKKQRESAEHND